jgi:hypothetical protein
MNLVVTYLRLKRHRDAVYQHSIFGVIVYLIVGNDRGGAAAVAIVNNRSSLVGRYLIPVNEQAGRSSIITIKINTILAVLMYLIPCNLIG